MNSPITAVSVLGLGAMGSALASTFLRGGCPTTVWNRSASKAEPLVKKGAHAAESATAAISASSILVLCVLDYAAVEAVLAEAAAELKDRTIVNLTTGRPTQARKLSAWVLAQGAEYLDGGIMAVPPMIGQPESLLLFSGSRRAYERHRAVLDLLGSGHFVGEDAGKAALQDFAILSGMYGLFAGAFQALALIKTAGGKTTDFAPLFVDRLKAMASMIPDYARQIDAGDYTLDVVANAGMQTEALRNILEACREQGVKPDLLAPLLHYLEIWCESGRGAEDVTGVVDLITAAAAN